MYAGDLAPSERSKVADLTLEADVDDGAAFCIASAVNETHCAHPLAARTEAVGRLCRSQGVVPQPRGCAAARAAP